MKTPPELLEKKLSTRTHLYSGILKYKLGDFREAYDIFYEMHNAFPEDKLPRIYMKRCKRLLENPPRQPWSGAMDLQRKS